MLKSLPIGNIKPTHLIYIVLFAIFILGFFVLPTDRSLHRVFIYGILIPFIFIARDVWTHTSLFRHPLFYCMVAYLLFACISSFWTTSEFVISNFDWDKPLKRSVYILVFCLAVAWVNIKAPEVFQALLTALIAVAAVVAFLGIAFWWVRFGGDFSERLWGITRAEHAIQGAASFAVIFLLSLIRYIESRTLLKKIAYVLAASLCLLFVLLAQTRGVLIAVCVAALIIFILKRNFKPLIILGLVAVIVLCLSYFWVDWSTLGNGLTRNMPYRLEMWKITLLQSLQVPWLGHGFIHDPRVTVEGITFPHAHNIYVSTFFLTGLVGLALYGLMVLCSLYYAYLNRFDDRYLFAGVTIVFASIAMLSDIGKVIMGPTDLWFYFWFPMGIILSTPHR
ncbi:MAG: O-antigen ligase family protein [Legionellales bacterium]|jgi:O-antigen ligase